jgi:hypothetical protein
LTWLDELGLVLEHLTQEQLELWLSTGSARSYRVRRFLGWAADRSIAPRLVVPTVPRQDPVHFLDENERWNQLRRCINDTVIPSEVRAAGALVLLFGLPTSRILHLRAEHLLDRDDGTYLDVGSHPMIVPPKLATLLNQLTTAPNPSRFALNCPTPTWLFPGRTPGKPAGPSGFSKKLQAHGINARPARNAALVSLVSDIPAPVLAELLDLHPSTAVRWATLAKRDWTSYLAARAENLRKDET